MCISSSFVMTERFRNIWRRESNSLGNPAIICFLHLACEIAGLFFSIAFRSLSLIDAKRSPERISSSSEDAFWTGGVLFFTGVSNNFLPLERLVTEKKSWGTHVSKFDFLPESSDTNRIDPDLDRRLEALRSKPSKPSPKEAVTAVHEDIDNLFARFAALKAPSKATATSNSTSAQQGGVVKDDNLGIVDDEDEEDEVSKIINWAIDAARLDPSPSSDIDDDADEDDDSDDDSDDDDASHTADRKKKTLKK